MHVRRILVGAFALLVIFSGLESIGSLSASAAVATESVTPTSTHRSGQLTIRGAGFGTAKGSVRVGGYRAPVARWTDTAIVAYVPERAALGTAAVRIVAGGVATTVATIQVEARAAAGRLAWRFETLGTYVAGRPAVGADGTVYASDSAGLLYAVAPDGGLRWIYNLGGLAIGPVSVGQDGTIYAAAGWTIHAVRPDGSRRWRFVDAGAQSVIAGPSVGPDGNVYAVFDGPSSLGVVSLTPDRVRRWAVRPNPAVGEVGQEGEEIVFGSGQLYFSFDRGTLWGFTLAGALRFATATGGSNDTNVDGTGDPNQPAVGPDGTIYVSTGLPHRLKAYTPSGALKWAFLDDPTNELTPPSVGTDGVVHVVRNLREFWGVRPAPATAYTAIHEGIHTPPIVNEQNTVVVAGGARTFGDIGIFRGVDPATGSARFTVQLPLETTGACPTPNTRARFSPDGTIAYVGASRLCAASGAGGLLYAIDSTGVDAPVDTTTAAVESFYPTAGPTGTAVTLKGRNLSGATAVTFNGKKAAFRVWSPTEIYATVPNGATSGIVAVTTPAGVVRSTAPFTVTQSITGLSPATGPVGSVVRVSGVGFTEVGEVTFGGVPASFTVVSPTAIDATVPASAVTGTVVVTTARASTISSRRFVVE